MSLCLWLKLSSLNESYFFPCSFPRSLSGSEQLQLCLTLMISSLLGPATPSPWGALAQQVWIASKFVTGRTVLSQIIAKEKWLISSYKRDWFFFFFNSKQTPSKNKRQVNGQFSFSAPFHKAMTKGWQAHSQAVKWMNFPSPLLKSVTSWLTLMPL